MPTPILMPALSPTMEQGKLAKWLKKEGDKVASGDAIAEIETDKATMEVEAVDEGTIGKIMVAEGTEGVAVNTPIALLLGEGEDAAALKSYGAEPPQPAPAKAGQEAEPVKVEKANGAPAASQVNGHNGANGSRVFASPLARRIAKDAGIDLGAVKGTGPHGRIVKHDIEEAKASGTATPAAAAAPAQNGGALVPSRLAAAIPDDQIIAMYERGTYELRPLDNMRKTIAARLTQATQTIPHFRLFVECEIDTLLEARQRINMRSPKDGQPGAFKVSVNDFIVKALGLALQRVPDANATFTERGILLHKASDVGVAVAVEGGLFTPVIRGVEQKSLADISNEVKDLAERARKRRLAPHEYQGGTTAVSNLGMFGVDNFDAVINPPHATILAVGRGEKRAVVKGGQIVVATTMGCTLSCDHRVVDGALGARLLQAFKGYIEEPVTMLA
ncbi:pyruvate dehydrogenase complex dihydrolipoamide acetyltransferase [Rhodomicrobium sp. Az07]|uniref:pyruvate dehydrogenase complex dihydrolipoamide acetyltransferase n=1 Tax=Rhodomicrobium sp. Az07 TaxID=2839034 RepID=UPI001BEA4BE1|nr:pyruvate dehydrogenase complex dihydrolipoamide acetyltransferase [Rhodomicrobium sp. Az07]MBT3071110.1 pyruvate dehydrogenase complex dihydrolipoamide acetyltransferase [Rhodomicrobium sp. Az07]